MTEETSNKVPPISEVTFDEHLADLISDPKFGLGFIFACFKEGEDCFYEALKLVLEARKK